MKPAERAVPGNVDATTYADLIERSGNRREQIAHAEERAAKARVEKANGTKAIEIWTPVPVEIEDLMKAPPPKPDFIIGDLLPPGLTFIAGRPKQGKSLLCLGMALSIASGVPFWGRDVRQGRVLYLDLESANWRVYERVKKTGMEVPSGMTFFFDWRRGNRQALFDVLDARSDVRLIVIDVWRKFALPQPRHVDAYEHEQEELQWLSKLGTERGISLLAVGHTVKNPSVDNDVFAGVGGSSAITGNSDAVMLLRREGEDGRVLYMQGRDLGEAAYRLRLDDHLCFHCLGDASLYASDAELRYLLAINNGAITPSRIAFELNVSRAAVSQMLRSLHDKALIDKRNGALTITHIATQLIEGQSAYEQAYREASGR
ncbi:AAA family ATPase [Paraburkholderia sp. JHI869]|uniref:AAA family ATPase n=1 Tax=Paraburkholderia sp. JHI869 TaxID=3112959 RepID=UPI00318124BE